MPAVKLYPLVSWRVTTGSAAVVAAYGPMLGGYIQNPRSPDDQGIAIAENLYVSLSGPAGTTVSRTTRTITPGDSFRIPAGFDGELSINAITAGHKFSGFVIQDDPGYTPSTAAFPPAGPTTLTQTIPSYLYVQYNDDENLQAFVDAYNAMAQEYVDWFVNIGLPVYTGERITGALLDWVAAGLYGMTRPALPSGRAQTRGPYNTFMYNTLPYNELRLEGPTDYYLTSDDVFKRILTWHLYKGDGKTFNVRWLKRRVMRFLIGEDGGGGPVNQTYPVSVTWGTGNEVNINLQSVRRYARGGAIYGAGAYNSFQYNQFETTSVSVPVSPLVPVFKAAVEAGVLELPFQFEWIVNTDN